ncbi:putative GTPase IMAP family member 8-like, partial [Triplophysa rosa]
EDAKVQQPHKDISLVLLGLNNNKCMIGNAILQEDWFGAGKERHTKVKQVEDRSICVINTPDNLCWPNPKPDELNPSYPDPRVFLLVLEDNKLSQEEVKILDCLKERFGEKMVENTIVVLVRGEAERSGEPNERADESLEKVLDECGTRVCVYKKNQDMKESELMKQLMEIWDNMEANSASGAHVYEEVDDIGLMKMKQTDERNAADITVVLLGKNNDDKCLIGNIILGEERFQSESAALETNVGEVVDQSVLIIKTPDSFHSDAKSYMMREMKPSYTGPRAFLLLLQENEVSQEETTMINQLKRWFGDDMVKTTIVLVDREKLSSHSLDKFIVNFTKDLLEECGNRVCYYNRDIRHNKLVKELMKYTTEIFQRDQASKHAGERSDSLRVPPVNFMGPNEKSSPLKLHVEPTPNKSAEVLVHQEHPGPVHQERMAASSTMTIVLLGQTGSGKSATGNTILGKQYFESHASSVPVTQVCQKEEVKVCGVKITVVDTPDFFNEDLKNREDQLRSCKDLIQRGPVVYLLVMELGRFTDGEREVLPRLKKEFGEDMTAKTVILFTNKEKLTGKTLNDYINETDEELKKLIQTCHSRCCAFNNNKKNNHQVKELMDVILRTDRNMLIEKSSHHKKHINPSHKVKVGKICIIS